MFSLNASIRYYFSVGSTDLRKGFDTLCGEVRDKMRMDPLDQSVYIFVNKSCTSIKLLHWQRGGLVIYHKRLESGRFTLPLYDPSTCSYRIDWHELVMMIEGISIKDVKMKKRYQIP